tara:strand:+ start:1207 stop:2310 length:1104 start_codon:yes stop_codon:yes gene_type:complete
MPFDFSDLKTVSLANGEVTLRIPRRWDVVPDEANEGRWGCYEEEAEGKDTDTGTLWVQVDHIVWEGDSPPPPVDTDMAEFARESAEEWRREGSGLLESDILEVEHGCCWRYVYDGEEDGESLRFWNFHFFLNQGGDVAFLALNLVLTHAQMDDPEFIELREIIEREIANAFMDPFKLDDQRKAEEILGPMRICNFADWVKISLPEAMEISFDEKAEQDQPRWYGLLETESSRAVMFVDCQKMELRDEDGELGEVRPEMYREVLEAFLDDSFEEGVCQGMPSGVVVVDTYENTEGIGETEENGRVFQGFRKRMWRYMVFGEGQAQLLTVLLIVPLPEWDRVPYVALRNYLDGSVRRAEFPGFEATARF